MRLANPAASVLLALANNGDPRELFSSCERDTAVVLVDHVLTDRPVPGESTAVGHVHTRLAVDVRARVPRPGVTRECAFGCLSNTRHPFMLSFGAGLDA